MAGKFSRPKKKYSKIRSRWREDRTCLKTKDEINNKLATNKENSGDQVVTGHNHMTGNTCATRKTEKENDFQNKTGNWKLRQDKLKDELRSGLKDKHKTETTSDKYKTKLRQTIKERLET